MTAPVSGRLTRTVAFSVPDVTPDDIAAVDAVLASGWLTTGNRAAEFELLFASEVGARHAIAMSSCTAALQIGLACLQIGPGDEVLVPAMTFASAVEVVLHAGATPVLVDVRPDDLTIDVSSAESMITPRSRCIMPMDYGGQPYDVRGVRLLAERYGLAVLEDAAHAPPASYEGQPVGSLADLTCFSFYANKPLTTGEGGMLVTDRDDWAVTARSLSLHGLSRDAWSRFKIGGSWNYDVTRLGYKSNLSDIAAAMGVSQLARVHQTRERRAMVAAAYDDALDALPGITPLRQHANRESAWHLYVVRLDGNRYDRDEASRILGEWGIGTSVHYKPIHRHPYFASHLPAASLGGGDGLPHADAAFDEILSLPLSPTMTADDVDCVVACLDALPTRRGG